MAHADPAFDGQLGILVSGTLAQREAGGRTSGYRGDRYAQCFPRVWATRQAIDDLVQRPITSDSRNHAEQVSLSPCFLGRLTTETYS